MKRQFILPTLLATLIWVGPVLAADSTQEALALEREALAQSRSATDQARREIERTLQDVQNEIRLAQTEAGKAVAAVAPSLKRAFGASFVNSPEQPLVVATSKLEPAALAELREDLNVMTKLVQDSVADRSEDGSPHRAMGIVVKWLPGGGNNNSLYVEGAGAIIQATVRFPLRAPQQAETKAADAAPKNSAWESARRELYGGKGDEDVEVVFPPEKAEEFRAERVESLKKAVVKALQNASNFRRLGANETVSVVIRSRTGNRSEFVMFHATDSHNRIQRSGTDDDATMTIRVKKSDADALAAGKINEEEFLQRAQVSVY